MTDNEILESIYSDEVNGFILLVDTYANMVYRIVGSILYETTQNDIEECVCDTFVAFYNNIDVVDLSRGSIRGYLGVIARRRAINLYHTICADDTKAFDEYTVEEMSDILENEELEANADLSALIVRRCLFEIAPEAIETETEDEPLQEFTREAQEEPEDFAEETAKEEAEEEADEIIVKNTSPVGRVLKTLVAMVGLVAVIAVGIIAFDRLSVPKYEPPTTTQTTTQAEPFNPLLSAIRAGNEKLIEELITNSLLITDEVLKFAIQYADKISYDSIRHIAEEVRNKYGSTGLEPILESAIFGDFKEVEEKLRNKDESELTAAEKLALFFAETFGSQAG